MFTITLFSSQREHRPKTPVKTRKKRLCSSGVHEKNKKGGASRLATF
jgi:hypothetical protein